MPPKADLEPAVPTGPETAAAPAAAPTEGRRRPRAGRRRIRRLTTRDRLVITVLLGLPLLFTFVLVWATTLASIGLSFTNWDGIGSAKFIGVDNYKELFTNYPPFATAIWHNLLWLGFLAVVATPLGLLLAVLLDRKIRFGRFYQSAIYLPVVLSLAVIGFISQLIFARDDGILNTLLGTTGPGGHPVDWIGNPHINIWVVLLMAGWRHSGYVMVLYLAGLKGVDPSLKEAAAIDGANARQTFFRVVFPVMRPVNIIVGVITVIEALRAFDIVYAINGGTNGLELLSVLITDNIIGEASRIGFGSAIAVVLLLISVGCIVAYCMTELREEKS
ncbi:sugar ABC transporter permease [Streptacidiphilus pinicola]|uniref:Sugar ABC transporter permease n=1 Tax=Streptacidiphilus pinicola TaxID=2219663 RepID=A0A2X0K0I8_9ACTN|nr:sugar ABC transporter permease [Streptacidiphilus pinicola]RAG80860.1 sugar ABC transporter permease [Streptacidiphilus pinicola]